jgi:light-regulated signal transduction histidine kinase (bacteriophytochrome)
LGSGPRLGTFIRDITALKQTQADLKKLNNELENRVIDRTRQLEMTNRELEAFSYSVSHDLRAPLRSINGYTTALQEDLAGTLSEETRGYLQRIAANIKRMDELINALLDLSRLGRKPLEYQWIQLADVIRAAWEDVCHEAGSRKISIQIDDPPDCSADRVLLKQVYVNLLSNAIKYTRLQPEAAIHAGWTDDKDKIVYWVKDNGVGFDMQYADKLFGIFQRLHRSDQFEGNGVGLSIVQRIVFRHGGHIWAEAYPNQGATFYFTLGHKI